MVYEGSPLFSYLFLHGVVAIEMHSCCAVGLLRLRFRGLAGCTVLALIGLVLGVGGALLVDRTMQSTLYEVGKVDLSVISSVAVILLLTALLASYLPARRAASIDPM